MISRVALHVYIWQQTYSNNSVTIQSFRRSLFCHINSNYDNDIPHVNIFYVIRYNLSIGDTYESHTKIVRVLYVLKSDSLALIQMSPNIVGHVTERVKYAFIEIPLPYQHLCDWLNNILLNILYSKRCMFSWHCDNLKHTCIRFKEFFRNKFSDMEMHVHVYSWFIMCSQPVIGFSHHMQCSLMIVLSMATV